MPRYYFDTDDGDGLEEDDVGLDLPDHEAARAAAVVTLPDLARDRLPDGDRRDFRVDFRVRVRDAAGRTIYSARLALTEAWHVPYS